MQDLERSSPDDLPEPSAMAILFRVAMSRWIASIPKDQALRILRGMAEDLATEESLSNLALLRPPPEQKAVNVARRQAIAAFRRFLPVWLAAIDEADD